MGLLNIDMALPPGGLATGQTIADYMRRKQNGGLPIGDSTDHMDPNEIQTGLPPAGQTLEDSRPEYQPPPQAALPPDPTPAIEVRSPHERAIGDMQDRTDATGTHYKRRGIGTILLDAAKGAGISLLQGGSPILGAGAGAAGIFRQQGLERDIAQHEDRYADQDKYASGVAEAEAKRRSEKSVQDDRIVKEQQRQQSLDTSKRFKEATAQNYKDVLALKASGQLLRDKQAGGKLAEAKADDIRQLMRDLRPDDPNFTESRKNLNDALGELLNVQLPDASYLTRADEKAKTIYNEHGGTSIVNPTLPNAPAVEMKNEDGTQFRPLPKAVGHGRGGSGGHTGREQTPFFADKAEMQMLPADPNYPNQDLRSTPTGRRTHTNKKTGKIEYVETPKEREEREKKEKISAAKKYFGWSD